MCLSFSGDRVHTRYWQSICPGAGQPWCQCGHCIPGTGRLPTSGTNSGYIIAGHVLCDPSNLAVMHASQAAMCVGHTTLALAYSVVAGVCLQW